MKHFWTLPSAAKTLHMSRRTLHRYAQALGIQPWNIERYGQPRLYVFCPKDMERLKVAIQEKIYLS